MKKFIWSWLFLTISLTTNTAQSLSGIINSYAKVIASDLCTAKLTVSDTTGFRTGTRVIIIQMDGASIKSGNNASFGQVEDMGMVGKYEVNEIDKVVGRDILLRFYLKNEYQNPAAIQIITFPKFDNAIVTDTLKAKPWNGESGGIIAFTANTLTLNAPILASGAGYRGGKSIPFDFCEAVEQYNSYFYNINTSTRLNGAPKGEGIAAIIAEKECGRGPQSNGGGGGNNHKSGGGGGGHLTSGGIGGQQKRIANTRNCNGDHPGLGGIGVGGNDLTRLFLGGGGGAGHSRNSTTESKGGNGGGLILIEANSIIGNGKTIAANGISATLTLGEGAGGGGAGGTVVLKTSQITGALNVEVKGGRGGDSGSGGEYDFGCGGGGAGGHAILTNTNGVLSTLTGGEPGRNAIQRSSMGATAGENGVSKSSFSLIAANDTIHRTLFIAEQPQSPQVCEFRTITFSTVAKGIGLTYRWQIDRGDGRGFQNLEGDTTFIGVASPVLILNRVTTRLNPFLFQCVVTEGCGLTGKIISNPIGLNIIPAPIPVFTISPTYNTVTFFNGTANATRYLWDFGDGQTSTDVNPVYSYRAQGTYSVTLKAINSCDTVTYTQSILLNQKPKSNFASTSNDYCVPALVRFSSTASNNSTAHKWIFEGGEPATSNELNPVVTYTTAGIFPVSLIVSNANGADTLTRQNYIRTNSLPIAKFRTERVANNPTVSFVNETLYGTDFTWDFGDGTTRSNDANPQHVYTRAGVYVVCMTATNVCGSTGKCDTIILNSLPSASINASKTNICSGEVVNFSGQNPTNVVSWQWTFEGGSANSLTIANPSVTYPNEGTYTVKLKVTNVNGIFETERKDFIKVSKKPFANFKIDSVAGSSAWFTNLSDSAAVGTTYSWNFYGSVGSNLFNPGRVIFPRNGNYNVTLNAVTLQCSHTKQLQLTIFMVNTKDLNTEGGLTAYPNPTEGRIMLKFDSAPESDLDLQVANSTGQVVARQKLTRQAVQEADFSHLPSGMYFLTIKNTSGVNNLLWQRRVMKL
jgi:PKD repeat protein